MSNPNHKPAGSPGGTGGEFASGPMHAAAHTEEAIAEQIRLKYPKAGSNVSGMTVLDEIPNTSSIEASVGEDYQVLGVREIPFSSFGAAGKPVTNSRTRDLAAQINQSKEIKPLIVVEEARNLKDGPYILEGSHRFDALQIAGKKSFPALVVLDKSK